MQRNTVSDENNEGCAPLHWIEGGTKAGAIVGGALVGGVSAIPGGMIDFTCIDPNKAYCAKGFAAVFGFFGAIGGGTTGCVIATVTSPCSFFGSAGAKCKEFNEEYSIKKLCKETNGERTPLMDAPATQTMR